MLIFEVSRTMSKYNTCEPRKLPEHEKASLSEYHKALLSDEPRKDDKNGYGAN